MKNLYKISVELKESNPKIWRRLLIPSNLMLSDLHRVLQVAMGWTNSHLHHFIKDRTFYTVKMEDDEFCGEMNNVDYSSVKVSDLLKKVGDSIIYEYDFGDGWEHDIVLEEVLPESEKKDVPVCIEGERRCPPENCGGVWGYKSLLEIISTPSNEQYDEIIEWLGEDFDSEYFNQDEVNEVLSKFL